MQFPKTDTELRERGYQLNGTSLCKGCNAKIDWWTTPNGKHIPMDSGTVEPHWNTCPKAKEFRREGK